MIVSKPKSSTLFSLVIFLLMAYGLSVYLIIRITNDTAPSFWMMILLGIATGAGLAVTYKTLFGYKKVWISKNRIDVRFAFNLIKKKYYFKELLSWKETVIKTASGTYRELTLQFDKSKKLRLTTQENDNYEKIKAFMQRNYSRKQQ